MNRSSRGDDSTDAWPEGDKMPLTPGRRETRCYRHLDGVVAQMHWQRSTRYPVDADQDITADRCMERKNKEDRSDELHWGGGARSGPRGVREHYYAVSPDGFQLGGDPAIWMRLYKRIQTV